MMGRGGKKTPAEPTLSELALRLEPDLSKGESLGEADMTLLWSQVGADFGRGIQCVAGELEVSEAFLLKLLADSAAAEAEAWRDPGPKVSWRWLKAHWPEFTFAALAMLAAFLVLRATDALAPRKPVVLKTVSRLPAYRVIRPEDFKPKAAESTPESGAFDSADEVVGLYTLQPLAADTILRESQLSGTRLKPDDMAGRQLLSLPVKAGTLAASITPAMRVSLLFAPQKGEGQSSPPPLTLKDFIVLSVDRGATPSIVVAAPAETDMTELAQRLGTSDVYVLSPAP